MVTASKHNNIDTLETIVLGDENEMQDDLDICEHASNT